MEQATPPPVPILTYTLLKCDPEQLAAREQLQPTPETPSEWFAKKFPTQAEQFGPPLLEAVYHLETHDEILKKIIPSDLNDDFFAGVLGGDSELGHHVIYYLPELNFYFFDARFEYYAPTSEPKLMTLLSQYLLRCATEMPKNVDIARLFNFLRSDDNLKRIVKKARSLLAANADFFQGSTGHKRLVGNSVVDPTAIPSYELFVKEGLVEKENHILTIGQTFDGYLKFCEAKAIIPVRRKEFKWQVVDLIKHEYGMSLRRDLKDEQDKFQQGWKGVACRSETSTTSP
jgi:hypothetical protein